MDALRARLVEHAGAASQRPANDLFRMPVDRAFSVAGIGTVVTGTAWSGRLAEGEAVVVLPGRAGGRVRSLETHGMRLERSVSGARTAVGISGLDREAAYRGAMLVQAGSPWTPSSALDVEITLEVAAPRPLGPRARVRLHLGTAEVMARVMPRAPIAPGERGPARLALEQPLVARGGDRFVLRSYSPVATIGGGWVLDPIPPRRRVLWPTDLGAEEPEARFRALVERRPSGLSAAVLPVLLGLPPAAANDLARREPTVRRVGDHWVATAMLERTAASALDVVRRHHRGHPSDRGMPLETLRRSLKAPDDVAEAVLDELRGTGRIRRLDGVVALAGFAPRVEGGDAEIDRLVQRLESASLTPPSLPELERETGRRDVAAMLRLAAASGRVEPVERDRYYTRGALDRFVAALEDEGRQGDIVPSTLRQRLGISRKYLIPLLEWADGKGITVRIGDTRRLKRT
jgi:selenocysteine-specific elongation factor